MTDTEVNEFTVEDSELARLILSALGISTDASLEPGADRRRDIVARVLFKHRPAGANDTLERLIRKVVAEELDKRRPPVQWPGDPTPRLAPAPLPAHNHGGLCCKCSCRNGGSFTSDPAPSW